MVVKRHAGFHAEGTRRRNRVSRREPERIESIEPQRPVPAVGFRNLLQPIFQRLPKPLVGGGGFRTVSLTFEPLREQSADRKGIQRITPFQLALACRVRTAEGFEGNEQLLDDMLALLAVIFLEFFTFEARGDAIRDGDAPLQKSVRLVMAGGGVDKTIRNVAGAARDEWRYLSGENRRQQMLDLVEAEGCGGGVIMRMIIPLSMVGAIEMDIIAPHPGFEIENCGAFRQFAEVVKQGGEGDATGRSSQFVSETP